jgi:hypothetical protein
MSERARGEDANVGRRDVLCLLRTERIAQGLWGLARRRRLK